VQETDLQAEGLRIPGFPAIIGPYGYSDIRGSLSWSLFNLSSLQNYLAQRHNFQAANLSAQDARDLVVLTIGNAYLTVIADAALVESAQAQVDTSKVSLDQAVGNHQAGTAPLLDELRARVDYQTQQQTLIAAKNSYEKDKIALARAIGLPLEQQFELTDQAPFAPFDHLDPDKAVQQALAARSDLKALQEQVAAADNARKALPTKGCRRSPSPAIMATSASIRRTRTEPATQSARSTCRFLRKRSCAATRSRRSRSWSRNAQG